MSNAAVHLALAKATTDDILEQGYKDEAQVSKNLSLRYRKFINPIGRPLSDSDTQRIQQQIITKASSELQARIRRGYDHVNLDALGDIVTELLRECKVKS